MFKKEITHFVLYFLEGNSNNKFSLYISSDVKTANPSAFNKMLNKQCIENHKITYGFEPNQVIIESIQMISIQISLFGWRVF